VIGADIGGTNLRLALANGRGGKSFDVGLARHRLVDASMVLLLIREGVDALLREASLPPSSVNAIAVGAPGVTDVDRGVVIATSYLMVGATSPSARCWR